MPYIKYRARGSVDVNVLKANSATIASDRILRLKNLEDLDLSNVAPPQRGEGEGLGIIGNSYINEWVISLAEDALRVHKQSLRKLNLEGNALGARGVMRITEQMDRDCVLEEISFGSNCLGHVGFGPLSDAIRTQLFLKSINISSNSIGDRGASLLATALMGMQSVILETFDAADNGIGERGSEALACALHRFKGSMKKINLERNDLGSRGTMHLAGSLIDETSTLQELHLGCNNIGAAGAAALADAFWHDTEICILNLSNNNIGDNGTAVLVNALQHHEKISELNLFKNNIGQDGAAAIATFLITNHSLCRINIAANCRIGDDNGGQRLACALETMENRSLTYFHVHAQDIGKDYDAYYRIQGVIRQNQKHTEMTMIAAVDEHFKAEMEQNEEQNVKSSDTDSSEGDGSLCHETADQLPIEEIQIGMIQPRGPNFFPFQGDSAFGNRLVQPSAPPASTSGDSFLFAGSDAADVESVRPSAPPLSVDCSSLNNANYTERDEPSRYINNISRRSNGTANFDRENRNMIDMIASLPPGKNYGEMDCRICYDQKMNCVLLPCSHMCCCLKCSKDMMDCPICRSTIAKALPIYKV